jgi:hypothetical protein
MRKRGRRRPEDIISKESREGKKGSDYFSLSNISQQLSKLISGLHIALYIYRGNRKREKGELEMSMKRLEESLFSHEHLLSRERNEIIITKKDVTYRRDKKIKVNSGDSGVLFEFSPIRRIFSLYLHT